MTNHDEDRIKKLLQQALPPVENDSEPGRDLWPDLLRRLDARPAPLFRWIWFDWALLAGLVAVVAIFPASIPMLLYYL
jgi:hypothetical protein